MVHSNFVHCLRDLSTSTRQFVNTGQQNYVTYTATFSNTSAIWNLLSIIIVINNLIAKKCCLALALNCPIQKKNMEILDLVT